MSSKRDILSTIYRGYVFYLPSILSIVYAPPA